MHQSRLKIIRLVLALLYVSVLTFSFLDYRELLPIDVISGLTFLQFLPSLLKFITILGIAGTGFVLIILLTALFGRVYCSVICPLGIFQDLISRIRKWTARKTHRYRYHRPRHLLRYFFMGLVILILLAGSMTGISLLDPYSIFGRMASQLFQPVYLWFNNRLAGILGSIGVYAVYPEAIIPAPFVTYLMPAVMLILIVWMSYARGRLFCNTVCPVGTLLGLVSRTSLFRIMMSSERCTKCAKCAFECKAECIGVKDLAVDFSRCIACYNCIRVCPEDAIQYRFAPALKNRVRKTGEGKGNGRQGSRREAIAGMVAMAFGLMGFRGRTRMQGDTISLPMTDPAAAAVQNKVPTRIAPVKHFPVTPPGSLGLRHFTNRCTTCHLCVSACPTDVLQPSVSQFGLSGFQQPHMDYSTNYCNFECVICSEVCPTGAILSLTQEAKKTLQLGQVHLILENCVVYAELTACGSCSEHCPTQAVTMVPYLGELTLPMIKPEICVGCGACEFACPVTPHKAIYVDGHEIHQVAREPVSEALEQPDPEEEFPF